ncbi:hypothetical protein Poly30_49320 [Planctomycetes bacterium Poly30]|uniref:Uncharacterized protein n=1 Tax=Saltatorellus ferox TaxID=2528018 RepID=A0A518EZ69_9BACT|nr:hypothetical protein Poly30_49320 [Planctomycetes bacterium Poly30]
MFSSIHAATLGSESWYLTTTVLMACSASAIVGALKMERSSSAMSFFITILET